MSHSKYTNSRRKLAPRQYKHHNILEHIVLTQACAEWVPDPQPHTLSWFSSEKGILLSLAELVPI